MSWGQQSSANPACPADLEVTSPFGTSPGTMDHVPLPCPGGLFPQARFLRTLSWWGLTAAPPPPPPLFLSHVPCHVVLHPNNNLLTKTKKENFKNMHLGSGFIWDDCPRLFGTIALFLFWPRDPQLGSPLAKGRGEVRRSPLHSKGMSSSAARHGLAPILVDWSCTCVWSRFWWLASWIAYHSMV